MSRVRLPRTGHPKLVTKMPVVYYPAFYLLFDSHGIGCPVAVYLVGELFFGNVELSLELWTVIVGISGFDD